jgi:hypothetical protein
LNLSDASPTSWDSRAVVALDAQLRVGLQTATSVEQATQHFADVARAGLGGSVVLCRVYLTLPAYRLPAREKAFALALAQKHGRRLEDETSVLTLMGTSGALPAWGDRRSSQGHVAIPLIDTRFVESVPMVASMLREFGVDLSWFDIPRAVFIRKLMGGLNGMFYVADAREARDASGRLIIPAEDFVAAHQVRTVFGVGGAYLNGWIVNAIFFTRAILDTDQLTPFSALAATLKIATMGLVARGAIFSENV